ncbi:MAG: magnesium transporter [Candidatus Eisenbacteria bacterium]|uniref:Magnesium transporter MgtE n=1 Tax=Eiseniibacteriota bacterium TaxID=2212470 RepID=A0A538S843_UNCEI|nr:MAG: magnesium transporter [Candidatus Eisenbacteria bacterium]
MSMRTEAESLELTDLQETWRLLTPEERLEAFNQLDRHEAEDFFLELPARDQHELMMLMPASQRRSWMRLLPPDDAADLVQEAHEEEREGLLALLDEATRREVAALLAYAEDDAGGLMNPRYARVRPDVSADEAISYLRRQARAVLEIINYVYVLDADQKLLGVVSFRDLFAAPGDQKVRDLMSSDVVTASEQMDQEELARLFAQTNLQAIPVVDASGRMKGIVTVDDIVDVIQEEATEDIQKIGGTQALEAPYLKVGLVEMVRKRVGWLAVLFVSEMLTTAAMSRFEAEIARAVVLAVFIPLIISSGGNSGSQASTLVIRAMALGEVKMGDWWRVVHRELRSGLAMGLVLGVIGLTRVELWQLLFHTYGSHHLLVGLTIAISVLGVVTWGTLSGSMLPFLLKRFRLDPASASAPFVATLVDVTGIVIYFTAASVILRGALL